MRFVRWSLLALLVPVFLSAQTPVTLQPGDSIRFPTVRAAVVAPDTVTLPAPPPDTITLPAPAPDTVWNQCRNGWTCTAPAAPPPPPPASSCTRTIPAASVSAINAAMGAAQPGDCINVPAGSYSLGVPTWTKNGTAAKPIILQGVGSATVFNLGGSGGIYLRGSYVRLRRLRVTAGFFGVQTEGVTYVELDSLEIDNLKQAAINLRYGTNHSVVKNSRIHDTGKATKRYGEGVYIGGYASGFSGPVDNLSDDNQVLNTDFGPNVTAEAVDISTGSDRTQVVGNRMDGTGTVFESGAMNALVGVNGFNNLITDNVLSKGAPMGIDQNGGSGVYRRNRIALFNIWNYSGAVGIRRISGTATVYCDNVVTNIPVGGAAYNVPCTP